jgi:Zn-dependent M32 family carboxypeptidase
MSIQDLNKHGLKLVSTLFAAIALLYWDLRTTTNSLSVLVKETIQEKLELRVSLNRLTETLEDLIKDLKEEHTFAEKLKTNK